MPIMRYRPMFNMSDFDKFFDDTPEMPGQQHSFSPALDIYQDKDNVIVETPLAGVDPEKVDITIEDGVLKIEGTAEHKTEVDEKNYYRKEVRTGSFFRSVALPAHVKGDDAKADFDKGMLKITIPKIEEVKPKKIKVTIKNDT